MRDGHRIKEKYDLSLDNRQIVSLFIAAIVVMGTVFVLGVVVGKNLAGNQRGAAAADLLSALDEKAVAMEQVRSDTHLTFQDELTKKAGPLGGEESPAQPARADAVEAKAVESSEPPIPSERNEPKQPAATANERILREAIARAEKRPSAVASPSAFTLQLSASQMREDADKFAAKLRERGYAPYVVESEVPGRGKWYRVRIGRFASKDAAVKYLADFRRETQLEAFVAGAN